MLPLLHKLIKNQLVKKQQLLLIGIFMLLFSSVFAQIGGNYTYSFLERPVSARVAALGTNFAAIDDSDINIGFVNPSLINSNMHNSISLAYVDFFSDINYGFAQYGRTFEKAGNFVATLQYYNYGEFDYADDGGTQGGTFGAADYAFNVGWGRQLDSNFSIGATAKLIYSYYESYNSFGFAVDVAGTYRTNSGWVMSLIASNIGMQLKTYVPGSRDPLPFNMQYAISKRLAHVPFMFSFVYDHIEKWDLTYEDPANPSGTVDPITGEVTPKSGFAKFGDQLMHHLIIGGEMYIGKNLILRGSYNYRRRAELKVDDKLGMVGFSWGIGVRISKFKINYARSTYHLVGSPNYLSLSFNLDSFKK